MKKLLIVLVVALLMPVYAFPDDKDAPFVAETGPDGVQHITMTGGDYYFKPARVVVRVNVPVEISITNESSLTPHNFVMKSPEAGIDISQVLRRVPTAIKFTPSKTGSYPFYCDRRFLFFKSHRDRGMEGTIEVVE